MVMRPLIISLFSIEVIIQLLKREKDGLDSTQLLYNYEAFLIDSRVWVGGGGGYVGLI